MEHLLTGAQATSELRNDVRRTLRSVSPEVLAFRVRAVMTCDATEEFARIRVPTLYVQGEQDRLVSKSSFEEIKALQTDVILAVIGGPHFVLQREPQMPPKWLLISLPTCQSELRESIDVNPDCKIPWQWILSAR